MKLLAFAASNSSTSINRQLARYAASMLPTSEVDLLDLNDYEMPLFSEDREKILGQPDQARAFHQKIVGADALLISFAEHNGSYSAAYKNLFDWTSRIDPKVFQGKPMVMLSTSPGAGGAATVLAAALGSAPYFNGDVVASLSVPSFYDNFDVSKPGLKNEEMNAALRAVMAELGSRVAA